MGSISRYILSVLTISLICGIALSLVPAGSKKWIRMLCGLIVTIIILTPISDLLNVDLSILDPFLQHTGETLSAQGEALSQNAMADIIIQNTEAYILDKAKALGIFATVEVTVSGDTIPVPVGVTLGGSISPYTRLQLESIIQEELGITKENIRWTE